jgi:ABC-2 type transport system ATP-binding protein
VSEPIIRTAALAKRFGDFTAVDDLTIAVAPGTIFAFIGGNGSGKSTTIRMLIGLLRPTAGQILVDGVDVIRHPRRVRDRIGYMGQKVSLYQGLSLRENVEFYAGLFGLEQGALERSWGALRERFELAEAEGERPEDLPAAIRQRAGLALSMLHHPRVLFLDEPTAGVDVRSRGLFWEAIQDEAARGVTVFVTTHFLEEVDYCDWVSLIDAGRLIADATPEELRRRFSDGYRITVDAAPAIRGRVLERLGPLAAAATTTPEGLRLVVPALEPAVLEQVAALAESEPAAAVHIAEAPMTEIFRRALAEAQEAR